MNLAAPYLRLDGLDINHCVASSPSVRPYPGLSHSGRTASPARRARFTS